MYYVQCSAYIDKSREVCAWLLEVITGHSGADPDKGMGGRYVDFLYTICRYIATIHTDIVEKLTRSVEIVSQKKDTIF